MAGRKNALMSRVGIKQVVRFSDFFVDDTKRGMKIPQSNYASHGRNPIIDQGDNEVAGYSDLDDGLYTTVPVVVFGDHTRIVKYVDQPFFIGADGVKILKPKNGVNPLYAFYALKTAHIDSLGYSRHFKLVKELTFVLPALPEQKRIAAELDKICELKKNAETRLEKLDLLVKSRFVEMFGDGKYPEVTIESLAAQEKNAFKAGPFGSALKKEFYVESGYKIYGQEQVIAGDVNYGDYYVDEAKYKSLENCKVQEGDVLVSLVGTYGKTLVIPHLFQQGIINPRLIKLTFDKKRILPVYFQHFFSLDSTRDMLDRNCHGCTMGVLNLGIIKALRIPLPPLALQREFAAFVEKVDKLKDVTKKSVEQMDTLYRAKLQEYFG